MRINDWCAGASRGGRAQLPAARREPGGGEGAGLTPERIAEVRSRILGGAYEAPAVVGRVADAVLRSGHL